MVQMSLIANNPLSHQNSIFPLQKTPDLIERMFQTKNIEGTTRIQQFAIAILNSVFYGSR
jgi:hypothetical protein